MSDDPRDEYVRAADAYDAACKAVADAVTAINTVGSGFTHHLDIFLRENFGVAVARRQKPPERVTRTDLARWPSSERLFELVTEWHDAFTELHAAWDKIPPNHRQRMHQPPDRLTLPAPEHLIRP